jgi:predicted transcriptional regulator
MIFPEIYLHISIIYRNITIDMGLTKTEIFTTEQNRLATMLKALAHPARIAILQRIIAANACVCGDLTDDLGLAQATISQHLKELKNAGLIQGTIEGVSVCYCIEPKAWKLLQNELGLFFNSYKEMKNCC